MLYMVIERFKNQDATPVYRRFRDQGRMTPEGLEYVSGWVDTKLERCFQIMETSDPKLMAQWTARWSDIVDFEVVAVMSSADAVQVIGPKL
ncbi:MAG: DUF3303 domain-containing protein [Gammaproteobacteria bacterium]|nr:MAG: DUF3303 domain-containing protein [Gammaproteobacteria bacterium]